MLAQRGSTTAVNPYTRREHEQAGAMLFRSQCAGCHGPDGTGTGAGPTLTGAFRHGDSDEAIFRTISKGLPGTSMPAFSFSGLQIWELVTHVRALGIAHGATQTRGDPRGLGRAGGSRDGKLLWNRYLGGQVASSPVTWPVDGQQYVSIASGHNVFTFGLPDR